MHQLGHCLKLKLSCPFARHEGEWRRGSEDLTPLILHRGPRYSSVASLALRSAALPPWKEPSVYTE